MNSSRLILMLSILLSACSFGGDRGPKSKTGEYQYEDYPRFQKDVAAVCRGLQLPGIDPKMSLEDRQLVGSHRALDEGNGGPEAKRILQQIDNVNPETKWSIFLAAAEEADLGRCPLAEAGYRAKSHELGEACRKGDATACQKRGALLDQTHHWIDDFIKIAKDECAKGRGQQCALPKQFEAMRQELDSGAP